MRSSRAMDGPAKAEKNLLRAKGPIFRGFWRDASAGPLSPRASLERSGNRQEPISGCVLGRIAEKM
ncbi:MAG: hypothetical protein DCC75_01550 [Proteobacteria bacterium]|nr:MAG: hypothetical protein DCC75_01550 [Pseudomonadota bacterium]